MKTTSIYLSVFLSVCLAPTVWADILEMKNGNVLNGRYVGCTTGTTRFETSAGMQVLDLEEKRTDVKRKYFKKFRRVIPALKGVRFLQIENQINMALDLQVVASLPLIK